MRSRLKTDFRLISIASALLWTMVFLGCKVSNLDVRPVSVDGVPLRGSDIYCPIEEDRGTPLAVGNVKLSQYAPLAVARDELADKVVPWSSGVDCDGSELVWERLVGRRRLGHTIPILGWFGIGRHSHPGTYQVYRTTRREHDIIRHAIVYFCVKDSITIDRVRFSDDDVIAFDGQHVAKALDGGDIGLGKLEIDALSALSANEFLVSFRGDFEIDADHLLPGLTGIVRDEDILRFEASSMGEQTRGIFTRFVDGSQLGLDRNADIDAVEARSDDALLLSFDRRTKCGELTVEPNDIVEVRWNRDVEKAGMKVSWRMLRQGDQYGLKGLNLNCIGVDLSNNFLVAVDEQFLDKDRVTHPSDVLVLPTKESDGIEVLEWLNSQTSLSIENTTLLGNSITALSFPPGLVDSIERGR